MRKHKQPVLVNKCIKYLWRNNLRYSSYIMRSEKQMNISDARRRRLPFLVLTACIAVSTKSVILYCLTGYGQSTTQQLHKGYNVQLNNG